MIIHTSDTHADRTYLISVNGVTYQVTIEVNLRKLAHDLVHKAIRNKSGKTQLCHRDIVVKAVKS